MSCFGHHFWCISLLIQGFLFFLFHSFALLDCYHELLTPLVYCLLYIYRTLNILSLHIQKRKIVEKNFNIFAVRKIKVLPCLFVAVACLSCQLLFVTDALFMIYIPPSLPFSSVQSTVKIFTLFCDVSWAYFYAPHFHSLIWTSPQVSCKINHFWLSSLLWNLQWAVGMAKSGVWSAERFVSWFAPCHCITHSALNIYPRKDLSILYFRFGSSM